MSPDQVFREEFGMPLDKALAAAKEWAKLHGEETFVLFRSNTPDFGKLYDWTTEHGLGTDDQWVKDNRIIWSSEDNT